MEYCVQSTGNATSIFVKNDLYVQRGDTYRRFYVPENEFAGWLGVGFRGERLQ